MRLSLISAFVVFWAALSYAGDKDCVFFYAGKPPKVTEVKNCAYKRRGGNWHVRSRFLNQIEFDDGGLSSLMIGKNCYWTNKKYVLMRTLCFDNGADYFKDGYARFIDANGKMGFMDQKLKVVVPPRFDFAFPFEDGVAMYCNGCKRVKDDPEHGKVEGGTWGFVDQKGKIVSKKK